LLKLRAVPGEILEMGVRARALFVGTYTADRAASQWIELLGMLKTGLRPKRSS